MKKFIAFAAIFCCIIAGLAFTACGKEEIVYIDDISIVEPSSTSIRVGETFTLDCVILPEEVAEQAKVNWEISDTTKLSYKNGEFTALTFGNVTVKSSVKGNDVYDEITFRVLAPAGYTEYSSTGYQLVYPSNWSYAPVGGIKQWAASGGSPNVNVTTETLNKAYMSASASAFQLTYEMAYQQLGCTVNFKQPVKVEKSNYLGVTRVMVTSLYSVSGPGVSGSVHQTQVIFNNSDANLSCVLTVTFNEGDYDSAAEHLEQTILSQFMPA